MSHSSTPPREAASAEPVLDPSSSRFGGHVISQATGAINDNIFRKVFTAIVIGAVGVREGQVSEAEGLTTSALLGLLFILPFIVLAPTAGSMSDRFPKKRIILAVRCIEPLLCLLAASAIWLDSLPLMMGAIAMLGIQSTFFSPVKYAAIPELVAPGQLARANGLLQSMSNLAILTGIALAFIADPDFVTTSPLAPLGMPGVVLLLSLLLCALGIHAALRIPHLPARNPQRRIATPLAIREQLRVLGTAPGLWVPTLALAAFWALAAIAELAMATIAKQSYGLGLAEIAVLNIALGAGLAVGSLLAPRMMLLACPAGLPLVAAIATGVCTFVAALIAGHPSGVAGMAGPYHFGAWLFLTGVGGGLWMVPLNVLLQRRSPVASRGLVYSAANVLGTIGLLVGFGLMAVAGALLAAWQIFALVGVAIAIGALLLAARARGQIVAWATAMLLRLFYRVEVLGLEHLPDSGGCIVVANHISFADGPLLFCHLPRPVRFLVLRSYHAMRVPGFFLRAAQAIPIDGERPGRATVSALRAAVDVARAGGCVGLFPEGKISRNGHIDRFTRGIARIAAEAAVPVVPVCIHGLNGDASSRVPHRRRLPRLRRRVVIALGPALPGETAPADLRRAVVHQQYHCECHRSAQDRRNLGRAIIAATRRRPFAPAVTDAQGSLSRLQLLAAAKAALPLFDLARDERSVGLLLPPGRAGAIANLAVILSGRTVVNLNHTVGDAMLAQLCQRAGVRTVISSRRYRARIGQPDPGVRVLELEDLLPRLSRLRSLAAALRGLLFPAWLQAPGSPDAVAAILFSSGSTGIPKGVRLTHRQILANARGTMEHLCLRRDRETILTPLPLFHSFGLDIGLWLALSEGLHIAAHPDPTDASALGRLAERTDASFLIATPTFIRGYCRRIEPERFAALRFAIAGAEKCPAELRRQFHERYGAALLEGYGCTELAPVVTVNAPDVTVDGVREVGSRDGSVGRSIPGVEVVALDADSGEPLPCGEDGLLAVCSPARMLDYLDDPEQTAAALRHGAYDTGDIGHVDADGYIHLTGRLARFAKIGGEMVPLDRVEEELRRRLETEHPESEHELAVVAVSDPRRGERLVVLHTGLPVDARGLAVLADELPALFRFKARDVHAVEAIATLGTGKRDLHQLQQQAEAVANAQVAAT